MGDTSRFARDTELIVGLGFSNAPIPGYPANQNSPILETDYKLVFLQQWIHMTDCSVQGSPTPWDRLRHGWGFEAWAL